VTRDRDEGQKQLARRFFELLGGMRAQEWIELWREDGVFEQPYAPPGFPSHLEGRDAIYNHVRSMDTVFEEFAYQDVDVRATDDPNLLLATLRSEATVTATGRRYANQYVALLRIRAGRVAHYCEYFDPLIVLDAFGGEHAIDVLRDSFNVS
jgi:uncharacterized protein